PLFVRRRAFRRRSIALLRPWRSRSECQWPGYCVMPRNSTWPRSGRSWGSELMTMRSVLSLRADHVSALIEGARDASPVSGLTHNFYRYPARFSPRFVRAAIQAFTKPGDLVIDP